MKTIFDIASELKKRSLLYIYEEDVRRCYLPSAVHPKIIISETPDANIFQFDYINKCKVLGSYSIILERIDEYIKECTPRLKKNRSES